MKPCKYAESLTRTLFKSKAISICNQVRSNVVELIDGSIVLDRSDVSDSISYGLTTVKLKVKETEQLKEREP